MNPAANAITNDEKLLREQITEYYADPYGFVCFVFEWGVGELKDHPDGPDQWQRELLEEVGRQVLADPTGYVIRFATATGHGVGKSALVSWLIIWFVATRYPVRGVTTANTLRQLSDKTWAELNLWNSRSCISHWFRWTATKFELVEAPGSSFVAAAPNSEHNSDAFQGLHAEHVLVLFDEASGIPIKIWDVIQGALTTPRAMMFAFGNPTLNTGRFRELFGKLKHRWTTRQIDSRTCKMTNKDEINKWIDDYGDDSDFVRVRVKGMFPRQSEAQFISGEVVTDAMERTVEVVKHSNVLRVMGVDIARYGSDQSVIAMIEGRKLYPLRKVRNMDTMWVAGWVADAMRDYDPHIVAVDGVGVGAGVVDRLKQMGHDIVEVNGGHEVSGKNKHIYYNKRAEMWGEMKEWLKTADIPDDNELHDSLIGPLYTHDAKRMLLKLETKEDMHKRGLASPDEADALSHCFYTTFPHTPKHQSYMPDEREFNDY